MDVPSKLSRAALVGLLLVLGVPRCVAAQVVRGLVVEVADQPVPGVLAMLLDGAGRVVARALTDEAGAFRLRAPSAGVYRIRTLRIGYQPTTSHRLQLSQDAELQHRIILDAVPVRLDTVRVEARTACRLVADDSNDVVFGAWEQVRAAIMAAQLTQRARTLQSSTIAFDRLLAPGTNRIRAQSSIARTEFVREPWREAPLDSLRRTGYLLVDADNVATFHAPGLGMLLAPEFVEDHCMRIGGDSDARQLAIEFQPVPERRRIPEIEGTLWLDRKSAELRRLEFRYVNVSREFATYARGEMEFARLRDGGWVISRWAIRMPRLVRSSGAAPGLRGSFEGEARVADIHVTGGYLATVVRRGDTLWSHPPITLRGVVLDSATRAPSAAARVALKGTDHETLTDGAGRFAISGVLPGEYTAQVRTASLDSANAVHEVTVLATDGAPAVEIRSPNIRQLRTALCGSKAPADPGILTGTVATVASEALQRPVRVVAEWAVISLRAGGGQPVIERSRNFREAVVAPDGSFRMCGVPVNTELSITALANNGATQQPKLIRIPPYRQFARVELSLTRISAGKAVFAGNVLVDSTREPVSQAEVRLPGLGRITTTDATGAFRIDDVVAGTHRVVVRRIGFAPLDTQLVFASGRRHDRRIYLSPVTYLDAVNVTAIAFDRAMQRFEDNRRVGLGRFLTRPDLARLETGTMASVLSTLAGLHLAHGRGSQSWVIGGRGAGAIGGHALTRGDDVDSLHGAPKACYARVYIDGRPFYRGRRGEPLFDVNSVTPSQLEAIEYYAGPAVTPAEYSDLGAGCGVLVLWTRRNP